MSFGQTLVGQTLVGQTLVGQMLVGQTLVGQTLVGQTLVGQMSVGQMLFVKTVSISLQFEFYRHALPNMPWQFSNMNYKCQLVHHTFNSEVLFYLLI
jgi:hypothetical protein